MIIKFERGKKYKFVGNIKNMTQFSNHAHRVLKNTLKNEVKCVEVCGDGYNRFHTYDKHFKVWTSIGRWNFMQYDNWGYDWVELDGFYNEKNIKALGLDYEKIKTTYKEIPKK